MGCGNVMKWVWLVLLLASHALSLSLSACGGNMRRQAHGSSVNNHLICFNTPSIYLVHAVVTTVLYKQLLLHVVSNGQTLCKMNRETLIVPSTLASIVPPALLEIMVPLTLLDKPASMVPQHFWTNQQASCV